MSRARQERHRIDGAEFSEKRNRPGPLRAQIEKRTRAAGRSCETGLDEGMLHESGADFAVATLDQAEDARVYAVCIDRDVNGLGDAWMGGVPLHHHRAARCQRRGGIAAGGGEGQRKVRGSEHANGPTGRWIRRNSGRGWVVAAAAPGVAAIESIALTNVSGK